MAKNPINKFYIFFKYRLRFFLPYFSFSYRKINSEGVSYKPILNKLSKIIYLRKARPLKVLEWGPGENTKIFASVSDLVISIESNRTWYERYKWLFSSNKIIKLNYIPYPDDPKGLKRYPGELPNDGHHYVAHPQFYDPQCIYVTWPLKQFNGKSFDIIFIDGGGYRCDCLRIARKLIVDEGVIVLHDYPPQDGKVTRDMPTGKPYDDIVKQFQHILLFAGNRTTLLSDQSDWFLFELDETK